VKARAGCKGGVEGCQSNRWPPLAYGRGWRPLGTRSVLYQVLYDVGPFMFYMVQPLSALCRSRAWVYQVEPHSTHPGACLPPAGCSCHQQDQGLHTQSLCLPFSNPESLGCDRATQVPGRVRRPSIIASHATGEALMTWWFSVDVKGLVMPWPYITDSL
jgi:hypothetical protein